MSGILPSRVSFLYPRGRCVYGADCPNKCQNWLGKQHDLFSDVPINPCDQCFGDHRQIALAQLSVQAGCASSSCGGFQANNITDARGPNTLCVCGQILAQHTEGHSASLAPMQGMSLYSGGSHQPSLSSSVSSATIGSSLYAHPSMLPPSMPLSISSMSTMPTLSSFAMSPMSVPLRSVPPITPFTYTPTQASSNVLMQRKASAQRNLPQHAQANTLTGNRGAASASARSSGSTTSAKAISHPKLEVLLILISHAPTVKHGLVPDLEIRFFQSDVETILLSLHNHNLAFTISHEHFTGLDAPIYDIVHAHLVSHLSDHGLMLPSDPAASDTHGETLASSQPLSFHKLPWIVLLKSRILPKTKNSKFQYKSDLNGYDLTLRLLQGAQGVKHPDDKNHLLLFIAPRFGDMSLPLTLFDLTPHCSCHAEPHICAPFWLLKPFIIFVKMKHSDDAYFECQEHACPICTSCGRSRHSSPPTPSVTPPPLPVSRVHHRSPASAANQNPAAARRRRIDSIGLPAIGSTQRPLATGLTPAITTMALTSARTGTSQLSSSSPHTLSQHVSGTLLSSSSFKLEHSTVSSRSHHTGFDNDLSDSDDSLPEATATALLSAVQHDQSILARPLTIGAAHDGDATRNPLPASPSLSPFTIAAPASQATMQDWYTILEDLTDNPCHDGPLKFYASDLGALARALLDYLVYLSLSTLSEDSGVQEAVGRASPDHHLMPWVKPDGVQRFSLFGSITEVMSTRARLFRAGQGAGAGVERTVLITAIQNMVAESGFWSSRGDYMIPIFFEDHLTNPRRLSCWKAFGQLCCLYLFYRRLGPVPICPSLIMVSLLSTIGPTGDEDLGELRDRSGSNFGSSALYMSAILLPIMSPGIIAAIDPALVATLEPWFRFPSDSPNPIGMAHPISQFVIDVLERNVIEFTSTRSPDDRQSHDSWTCEAFLKVLYRQGRSFLGLREFIAFRQGLMTAFPEESDFGQTVADVIIDRDAIPAFVLGLYKREIGDVAEFISQRLHFHLTAEEDTGKGKDRADDVVALADEQRDAAEQAFVGHFKRYLEGIGHPDHPVLRQSSLLSPSEFDANAKSKTLRVEMLLRALTDSPTLPLDELWCIHFAFPHHSSEDNSGAFLSFHTCTNSVDVLLTDDLLDLLVIAPSGDDATDFDAVIHAQLLMAPGEYNLI